MTLYEVIPSVAVALTAWLAGRGTAFERVVAGGGLLWFALSLDNRKLQLGSTPLIVEPLVVLAAVLLAGAAGNVFQPVGRLARGGLRRYLADEGGSE